MAINDSFWETPAEWLTLDVAENEVLRFCAAVKYLDEHKELRAHIEAKDDDQVVGGQSTIARLQRLSVASKMTPSQKNLQYNTQQGHGSDSKHVEASTDLGSHFADTVHAQAAHKPSTLVVSVDLDSEELEAQLDQQRTAQSRVADVDRADSSSDEDIAVAGDDDDDHHHHHHSVTMPGTASAAKYVSADLTAINSFVDASKMKELNHRFEKATPLILDAFRLTDPDMVRLTDKEEKAYRTLWEFMTVHLNDRQLAIQEGEKKYSKAIKNGGANVNRDDFVTSYSKLESLMSRVCLKVHTFREEMRQFPFGARDHGFVDSVDVILSTLVFQQTFRRETTHEEKHDQTGVPDDVKGFLQGAESTFCKRGVFGRFMLFTALLMIVTLAGMASIHFSWSITSENNFEFAVKTFHKEVQASGTESAFHILRNAVSTSTMLAGTQVFTELTSGSNRDQLAQLLYDTAVSFGVDSVYTITEANDFVGAFRTTRTAASYAASYTVTNYDYVVVQGTGSSWKQCANISNGVTSSCTSWVGVSFTPTQMYAYTTEAAQRSSRATGSQAWTDMYQLLVPSTSAPTEPFTGVTSVSSNSADGAPMKVGVSFMTPLYNSTRSHIGVLAIDVCSNQLSVALQDILYFRSSRSFLVDPAWNVIASNLGTIDVSIPAHGVFSAATVTSTDVVLQSATSAMRDLYANTTLPDSGRWNADFTNETLLAMAVEESFMLSSTSSSDMMALLRGYKSASPDFVFGLAVVTPKSDYFDPMDSASRYTWVLGSVGLVVSIAVGLAALRVTRYIGEKQKAEEEVTMEATVRKASIVGSGSLRHAELEPEDFEVYPKTTAFVRALEHASGFVEAPKHQLKYPSTDAGGQLSTPDMPSDAGDHTDEKNDYLHRAGSMSSVSPGHRRTISTNRASVKNALKVFEQKQQDARRRETYVDVTLISMMFCIILLMGILYLVWSTKSHDVTTELSEVVTDATERRVFNIVQRFVDPVAHVNAYVERIFNHDWLSQKLFGSGSSETLDRFILGAFTATRFVEYNQWGSLISSKNTLQLTTSTSSLITGMSIGFADGTYIAASLQSITPTDVLSLQAIDKASDYCLSTYFTKTATAPATAQLLINETTYVRNKASKTPTNFDVCAFNPTTQDSYKTGSRLVRGAGPYWTPVYEEATAFDSNRRRYTRSLMPVYFKNNTLAGVFAMDLSLHLLSQSLNSTVSAASENSQTFVMDDSFVLLAQSYVVDPLEETLATVRANKSENSMVSEAAEFLQIYQVDVGSFTASTALLQRALDKPLTSVRSLDFGGSSAYANYTPTWYATRLVPVEDFLQPFDDRETRSLLISVATVIVVLFVMGSSYISFRRRAVLHKESKELEDLRNEFGHDIVQQDSGSAETLLISTDAAPSFDRRQSRLQQAAAPVSSMDEAEKRERRHFLDLAAKAMSGGTLDSFDEDGEPIDADSLEDDNEYLLYQAKDIRRWVVGACVYSLVKKRHEQQSKTNYSIPLSHQDLKNHFQETAKKHIKDAYRGRDVVVMCRLSLGSSEVEQANRVPEELVENESTSQDTMASTQTNLMVHQASGRGGHNDRNSNGTNRTHHGTMVQNSANKGAKLLDVNRLPLFLYRIHTKTVYNVFYNLIVITHIALFFVEPDTLDLLRDDGPSTMASIVEGFCLAVEVFDVVVRCLIAYKWQVASPLGVRLQNKDSAKSADYINAIYAVAVFSLILDWILQMSVNWSFEYFFPVRPFLLMFHNESVLRVTLEFIGTLVSARNVFLLYLITVTTAASMGVILFRRILDTNGPQSSYTNFIRALTTTFVYVSTGENFTELIYPTFQQSPWYIIYWVVFALLGIFFVLAMVIGQFQHAFETQRDLRDTKSDMYKFSGMMAAFMLIDIDSSGELDSDEMESFLRALRPKMSKIQLARICDEINGDDASVNLLEFEQGIDKLIGEHMLMDQDLTQQGKVRLGFRFLVLERTWFRHLRLFIVLCNVWTVAMYGLYDNEKLLDIFMFIFLVLYVLELIMRLAVYGTEEFFYYSKYHEGRQAKLHMMANRFDFVIIVVSFVAYFVSRVAVGRLYFADDEDSLRFVMTFPLLRLFSIIRRTRELVFTLLSLIPQFGAILVVLLIVFFIYGVLGVFFLTGDFSRVLQLASPDATFDTLSDAMLTMFQLLIGEGWHEVMYAAIRTTNSFGISWFFISFILIVTVLITNLFIGIVLDSFQSLLERKDIEEKKRKQMKHHNRQQRVLRKMSTMIDLNEQRANSMQ
jgi:two pore calcium channel protein, plant